MCHAQEKEEYLYLGRVMDEHGFSISQIGKLGNFVGGNEFPSSGIFAFRTGTLVFTETQRTRLETRCNQVTQLSNFSPAWEEFNRSVKFIGALCTVVKHPEYDHQQMVKQLGTQSMKIQMSTNTNEFLAAFDAIYNHHRKNRISFADRSKGKVHKPESEEDGE